jgi:hypothetical protein
VLIPAISLAAFMIFPFMLVGVKCRCS